MWNIITKSLWCFSYTDRRTTLWLIMLADSLEIGAINLNHKNGISAVSFRKQQFFDMYIHTTHRWKGAHGGSPPHYLLFFLPFPVGKGKLVWRGGDFPTCQWQVFFILSLSESPPSTLYRQLEQPLVVFSAVTRTWSPTGLPSTSLKLPATWQNHRWVLNPTYRCSVRWMFSPKGKTFIP